MVCQGPGFSKRAIKELTESRSGRVDIVDVDERILGQLQAESEQPVQTLSRRSQRQT